MSQARYLNIWNDSQEGEEETLVELVVTSDGIEVRDADDGTVLTCLPTIDEVDKWCDQNNAHYQPL